LVFQVTTRSKQGGFCASIGITALYFYGREINLLLPGEKHPI